MPSAVKIMNAMELERFEALPIDKKRVLLFKLDDEAKEKGFASEKELREKHPHIWEQIMADLVRANIPKD